MANRVRMSPEGLVPAGVARVRYGASNEGAFAPGLDGDYASSVPMEGSAGHLPTFTLRHLAGVSGATLPFTFFAPVKARTAARLARALRAEGIGEAASGATGSIELLVYGAFDSVAWPAYKRILKALSACRMLDAGALNSVDRGYSLAFSPLPEPAA